MRQALGRAALVAVVGAVACRGPSRLRAQPIPPGPPPIPDTQPAVDAPLFLGQNTFANPLAKSTAVTPSLGTVRADSANSAVSDGPGPVGKSPVTGSAEDAALFPLLWDHRGGLTAGCQAQLAPGIAKACLAAVDPVTLIVKGRWLPPEQDLIVAGAAIDDQRRVVVPTIQGHVFVVQRGDDDQVPPLRVLRDIDVSASLAPAEVLLATTEDADGNIWFTTGAAAGGGGATATSTTAGYVTPGGQVVTANFAQQIVETGMAVAQSDVFVVTAPAGPPAQAAATGSLYDLTATNGQVQTVWQERYDAGVGRKPGGFTRGAGSAVVVLGDSYLAITDNADPQAHLLVYQRGVVTTGVARGTEPRLLCQVALFDPGSSAVVAAPIGYSSDGTVSVIVANGYRAPPVVTNPAADNSPANNMNGMAPGLTRVDVAADGSGCTSVWTAPLRIKAGPVLSTVTGLVYGYSQDEARADAGSYVWYFVAVDYRSGRVMWRQRAGAGGTKNDNFLPTSLGPNRTLYQAMPLGVTWMRDVTPVR